MQSLLDGILRCQEENASLFSPYRCADGNIQLRRNAHSQLEYFPRPVLDPAFGAVLRKSELPALSG